MQLMKFYHMNDEFLIFYRYSNDIYGNDKDKHGTSTPSLYLGHL